MKKLKTAIRAVLSLGILLCLIFGAAGCQGGKKERIIDLSEAYETGLLSYDDLVNISEVYKKKMWDDTAEERMIEDFGAKLVNAIKKAEADNICNGVGAFNPHYTDVTSKDLHVIGHYGTYNQCVALRMEGEWLHPDVVYTISIGGVQFGFTGMFIRIWVKES